MISADERTIRNNTAVIRTQARGGNHLISVFGEVDLSNCADLEAELVRVEGSGGGEIILDLSTLEFMDSTAVAVLVSAAQRSRADSNRLRVVRPTGGAWRIMELCGLDRHLEFVELPEPIA